LVASALVEATGLARVIEADSARAVWVPDPEIGQLIQPGAVAAVITIPSIGSRKSQHHFRSLTAFGASNMTEALASKTCTFCRGEIPPLTREQAELFHAQAPDWKLAEGKLTTSSGASGFEALPFLPNIRELTRV
jgi:hypothetical protein